MALTVTRVQPTPTAVGRFKISIADVTFDNSYATGGESITPTDLGLSAFLFVLVEEDADGYVVKFDRTNNKLMAFRNPAIAANIAFTAEVVTNAVGVAAAGANLQSGAGGPTATTNAPVTQAAGTLAEVANAVDLSAVTVRVVAFGT